MKKIGLRLETVEIRKLKPHPQNARVHSPEQLKAIGDSLQENGWTRPVLVNEHYVILAGHGTVKAAKQRGMTEAPVVVKGGLTQAQQRAYVLADNALAQRSSWDDTLLGKEMLDLKSMGIDLGLTGFDPDEIARLISPPKAQGDDEPPIPEPKGPVVSRVGDLWSLGRHRVICGDSTKPETLEALMLGQQAQCVFTDPPYGVSYQGLGLDSKPVIEGDDKRRAALVRMLTGAFKAAMPHVRQDAGWYIWHASKTREDFSHALRDVGLVEQAYGYLIWVKPAPVMGWTDYRGDYEPCFYCARQGQKPAFFGDRSQNTVWKIMARDSMGLPSTAIGTGITVAGPTSEIHIQPAPPKGKKVRHVLVKDGERLFVEGAGESNSVWEVGMDRGGVNLHPNQKPVELARRALKNSSQDGEGVLDSFGGSGSTLIAAEQLGRKAYLIELDPANVDVIVRRWQGYTSQEAIHADTGKPFNETKPAKAAKASKASSG